MKNKITRKTAITIGISAYNEEENIKLLLKDILKQKLIKSEIRQKIIVSDESIDNAIGEAKKIKIDKDLQKHKIQSLKIPILTFLLF